KLTSIIRHPWKTKFRGKVMPIWRLKKDKVDTDYAALWRDLPNAIGLTDRAHPNAVIEAV
ncbi:MAG TPA: hypothetical protein PK693_12520, partial [Halothiobacillus sp.]|nr:hypothetical protein [Halothiobacillus sp.]